MAYRSFEELDVWKRGCSLAIYVHRCTRETREYSLRDQMRRAAVSIPSNIAEGSERSGKDFARFLSIAKGSAAELRTQAYIAAEIEAISHSDMTHIADETKHLGRMMHALAKSTVSDQLKTDT